jgi:vesicle coat complex subunit
MSHKEPFLNTKFCIFYLWHQTYQIFVKCEDIEYQDVLTACFTRFFDILKCIKKIRSIWTWVQNSHIQKFYSIKMCIIHYKIYHNLLFLCSLEYEVVCTKILHLISDLEKLKYEFWVFTNKRLCVTRPPFQNFHLTNNRSKSKIFLAGRVWLGNWRS